MQDHRFIVSDSVRNVIDAAGGQVTSEMCCGNPECECHDHDHQFDRVVVDVQELCLPGSRGDSTAFLPVSLFLLSKTGVWLRLVSTLGRIDRLQVVDDVQTEIVAWLDRRRQHYNAGECTQPSDDELRQGGINPNSIPTADQLFAWQERCERERGRQLRTTATGTTQAQT